MNTYSPDDQLIAICLQMLPIDQEQDTLVERDPYAPDRGPYHEQHEALEVKKAALAAALTKAAAPPTNTAARAARTAPDILALDAEAIAAWLANGLSAEMAGVIAVSLQRRLWPGRPRPG